MIAKLAFLAVLLTAVQGNAVVRNSRQGSFNQLFLYVRAFDQARTPIAMPTIKELEDEVIADGGSSTLLTELDSSLDTIVVVHGHNGDANTTLNPRIKNAYFDERARADIDVSVIVLDWSTYTKQTYTDASIAVASVGKALGEYLKVLIDQERIQIDKLHLIGFNLGAHVVGFAGRELGGLAARITGLDPSGSRWGSGSPRLSASDARYVEILHTDGDGLLANGIGTPIGHVDFFVNGGSNQPGCLTRACSHNRAYELFADTLTRETPLEGRECKTNLQLSLNLCNGDRLEVGGDLLFKRHNEENRYRVNTGRSSPY